MSSLNVNTIMIGGNLGADPETRYAASGVAFTTFTVATTRRFKTKQDEKKEETTWHKVLFIGAQGETIAKYFKKGNGIFVTGRLTNRKWTDKQNVDHWVTEIVGETFSFVDAGSNKHSTNQPTSTQSAPPIPEPNNWEDEYSDDIPF